MSEIVKNLLKQLGIRTRTIETEDELRRIYIDASKQLGFFSYNKCMADIPETKAISPSQTCTNPPA